MEQLWIPAGEGNSEYIEKKSRFLGLVLPVTTEAEARAQLEAVKKREYDARHNCWAYVLHTGQKRYSDDGEPQGTAGQPILNVLEREGVQDVLCVVTRYFGGILLGAGGLVRAYSQGAAAALNACGVGVMHPTARYLLEVPYPMLGRLEFFLKTEPVIVEEKQFADAVILTLVVRTSDEEAFAARLTNMSEGRLEPLRCEEFYRPWPEEGQPSQGPRQPLA